MLYAAQGADHNLRELPGAIVRRDVQWDASYFTALALHKKRGTLGGSFAMFAEGPLKDLQYGYEVIYAQHHGLQSNAELGAALTLHSSYWDLGPVAVNVGAGVGLSHVFGTPSYEDGPSDDPERRYNTQLLMLFDMAWKIRAWEHFSLVTRVHHRSGAYGLIAPPRVGSNFLALGIAYDF
jgi:hypothetical protein